MKCYWKKFTWTSFRPTEVINKFGYLNVPCGIRCSEIWDGNGRWVNETWKPYLTGELLILFR